LDSLIHDATEKSGLPQADIMRHALMLGLRDLAAINYDFDGAIYDRLQKIRGEQNLIPVPQSLPDLPKKANGTNGK